MKVTFVMCLTWYIILARARAGSASYQVFSPDPIKIHVLVCLTSYLFFPVALLMTWYCNFFIRYYAGITGHYLTITQILLAWLVAASMLFVAVLFNAEEPNTLGISCLLFIIFYTCCKFTDNLISFIAMMLLASGVTSMLVFVSVHYAEAVRAVLVG